jgi:hypothetical protein
MIPASSSSPVDRFQEAISSQKIKDLPEIEVRKALAYCMAKIGLRADNYPKGIDKSLLLQHIFENFGELTPDEIKLAWDWAIDERLDLGEHGYNCFENFSCAYVSKILKAYLKRKNSVLEKPEQEPVLMIEYNEPITEEFKNSEFAEKLRKAGIKIPE